MRFGAPLPAMAEKSLDDVDRARATKMWEFIARERPISAMLAMITRRELRHARKPVAVWWEYGDAGLLFGESDTVLGHAIQWSFVCPDRKLWTAITKASDLPETFNWELDEEM